MTFRPTLLSHMMDNISDFHAKFGHTPYGSFKETPVDFITFREKFLVEEAAETMKAMGERDKAGALDGLVDLAYVAMGTVYMAYAAPEEVRFSLNDVGLLDIAKVADGVKLTQLSKQWLVDLSYGCMKTAGQLNWDFIEAWRRVHHANMQKVRVERIEDSKRGSVFDIVKPSGWVAPDLSDLVS